MSKGGRFAQNHNNHNQDNKPEKKKSGGFAKALVVIGVVLVLAISGIIGVTVYQATMDRMAANRPTVPTLPAETLPAATEAATIPTIAETLPPETTEPPYTPSGKDIINVLVIGDSYRYGEESRLTDTMILATINKPKKTITLTSFLRDSYVDLPDYMGYSCGWNRINVAYNLGHKWGDQGGALEMTNMTLDLNFGVKVDHNVVVDFDGFVNAINVLGEIPIELTEAEADYLNDHLNAALGYEAYTYQAVYEDGNTVSTMGGWEALTYARMRKAKGDGDSDIKRTARQRKMIGALINKVRYADFDTLMTFAKEILSQVTTDMTDDEIMTCMWEVLPLLTDLKIEFQQIPAEGTSYPKEVMVGEYQTFALGFDAKKNRDIMMSIAEADQLPVTPAN